VDVEVLKVGFVVLQQVNTIIVMTDLVEVQVILLVHVIRHRRRADQGDRAGQGRLPGRRGGNARRRRVRHGAHGRARTHAGLGRGTARARLELLLLRARSVGQLCRVFARHRLHPGRRRLARSRSSARRFVLPVGAAAPGLLHPEPRNGRAAGMTHCAAGLPPQSRPKTGKEDRQ